MLFLVAFYTDKVDEKIKLWKHINQHKLHQIDSTSLHLLFQRNFTSLNVINYQDFHYGIALPDIHLDLVFINDVLICQTLCPIILILQLPRYHRKQFLGGTSRCHREKWRRIFKQIPRIKWIVGGNRFLYRGIKYNIFGLIPKTSYVTQTLNIKYRGTIEPRATSVTRGLILIFKIYD